MFWDKRRTENQNRHVIFRNFSLENRAVYKIMWKNIVEPDRPQMTTWNMRIACCIPKALNTHSEYVTLTAFPLQQWLLRYTYIACLVYILELQTKYSRTSSNFILASVSGRLPGVSPYECNQTSSPLRTTCRQTFSFAVPYQTNSVLKSP
jgi:hypothetical protein